MTRDVSHRLAVSLLLLRIGLGLVMMVWAFDKLLNLFHAVVVFESFYGPSGVGESRFRGIGAVQAVIVVGFARTWTYGAVLAMHAVTTFVSWSAYLELLKNILFFSAWPMLAALIALFLLHSEDRIASLSGSAATTSG